MSILTGSAESTPLAQARGETRLRTLRCWTLGREEIEILDGDRNFNKINVYGKASFVEQTNNDLNTIASTSFGAIALAYIELYADKKVHITRARSLINMIFGCKSCEVNASITTDNPSHYSIAYSQYNNVQSSGVSTISYLTLVHEPWHVVDINFQKSGKTIPLYTPNYNDPWYNRNDLGTPHRAFWERRAVFVENLVAQFLNLNYFRTEYIGVKFF